MKKEDVHKAVRERYGTIAEKGSSCCSPACASADAGLQQIESKAIGYTDGQLQAIPEGADLGLGCGNPTALASLKEGEVVLDLGSGAGIDCFLAANMVGETGAAIGVDMTPEMIERARDNARNGGYDNVEFRLGEIENLPVADGSVDVVISNCVINLSPDKARVFKEAYRALRPGGRLMVSDIVLLKPLPKSIEDSIEAYIGCVAGASLKREYLEAIEAAGFQEVEVVHETSTEPLFTGTAAMDIAGKTGATPALVEAAARAIVSISVRAVKPR